MCKNVNALLQQAAEFGAKLKTARKTLEVTKGTLTRLRCERALLFARLCVR